MLTSLHRLVASLKRNVAELGVEQGYHRWAPSYGVGETPLLDLEEELRRRLHPETRGLRVLDLGCGRGRSALVASEMGARRCVGIDPVLGMLSRPLLDLACFSRIAARGDALPFIDEAFDVVISSLVLGHLPQLDAVLAEVRRVLTPGGRGLFLMFHPEAVRRGWRRTFCDQAAGKSFAIQTHNRSVEQYRRSFTAAGFVIVELAEATWQGQNAVLGVAVR